MLTHIISLIDSVSVGSAVAFNNVHSRTTTGDSDLKNGGNPIITVKVLYPKSQPKQVFPDLLFIIDMLTTQVFRVTGGCKWSINYHHYLVITGCCFDHKQSRKCQKLLGMSHGMVSKATDHKTDGTQCAYSIMG